MDKRNRLRRSKFQRRLLAEYKIKHCIKAKTRYCDKDFLK
jgi:hypothetical protein